MGDSKRIKEYRPKKQYFKLVFFKFYLKAVIPILCLQCLRFFYFGDNEVMLAVNLVMLLLSCACLFLVTKYNYFPQTVIVYCLAWVTSFCLFWLHTNGVSGPASYGYYAFLVVFTIILPFKIRIHFLVIFGLIVLCLTHAYPKGLSFNPLEVDLMYYEGLSIHYLLISAFIGATMIALKAKYEYERSSQIEATRQLEELTNKLSVQRKKLNLQQQEYQNMTRNLESLVLERTSELSQKNTQLHQMAYDNAHHIRGPLCNIKGVISIINKESELLESQEELKIISSQADKLDVLTQEINTILR